MPLSLSVFHMLFRAMFAIFLQDTFADGLIRLYPSAATPTTFILFDFAARADARCALRAMRHTL